METSRLSIPGGAGKGDPADLIRIYGPTIFRMARRAGLEEAEAEDVMHITLLSVLERMETFEHETHRGSFHGWLKTVTRDKARAVLRDRTRHPAGEVPADSAADPDAWANEFEHEWQRSLIERAFEIVRSEVTPPTFAAFEQRHVDGLSVARVANVLAQSPNQVSQNCRRVVQRMELVLQGYLDE